MSQSFLIRPLDQVCLASSNISIPSLAENLRHLLLSEQQKIFDDPTSMAQYLAKLKMNLDAESPELATAKQLNIFRLLGFYDSFNNYSTSDTSSKLHLDNDPNYCDKVDVLNLLDPTNLFEKYQIWNTVPFGP